MSDALVNLKSVDPSGAFTLVVGWMSGTKTKLRQILTAEAVEDAFRDVIGASLHDIRNREAQPWTPDANASPETFLVISTADLGRLPRLQPSMEAAGFDKPVPRGAQQGAHQDGKG